MPPKPSTPCGDVLVPTKPISTHADDAADQVDADDVERVVEAELELQADGVGTGRAGDGADRDRARGC